MLRHRGKTQFILFGCILLISACSSTDKSSQGINVARTDGYQNQTKEESGLKSDSGICGSINGLFEVAKYGEYGVKVESCGAIVSDAGDDVFSLRFNDPATWTDLFAAMGDIDEKDAVRYAFWRLPLGLLSLGFANSKVDPNFFDTIVISFANEKKTVYDLLPRDIAYAAATYDSSGTKEELSDELNKRIDEISERVDIVNLGE